MNTTVRKLASRTSQSEQFIPQFGITANVIAIELYDTETNEYVSEEELERLHYDGLATGYHVKMRKGLIGVLTYPSAGIVHAADPVKKTVSVNTLDRVIEFSLPVFRKIWEID